MAQPASSGQFETVQEHCQLSIYQAAQSEYQTLELHHHIRDHWVVSYVWKGSVEKTSGGEKFQVRAGDIMIHQPHVDFSECSSDPGVHLWLLIDCKVLPYLDLFDYYPVPPVVPMLADKRNEFVQIFDEFLLAWLEPASPYRNMLVFSSVLQLLGIVLDSWRAAGSPSRPPGTATDKDRLGVVIHYMHEHLSSKITGWELAELVHLHPDYFNRLFRRAFGLPPNKMLQEMRLSRAKKLLAESDAPLAAVAESCGLGEAAYMNRLFRARYGQTPGEYRKSMRNASLRYLPSN